MAIFGYFRTCRSLESSGSKHRKKTLLTWRPQATGICERLLSRIGVPAHVCQALSSFIPMFFVFQVDGISSEPSHLVAGVFNFNPCASWDENLSVSKRQLCEDLQGGCLNLCPDLTHRFRVRCKGVAFYTILTQTQIRVASNARVT